MASLGRILWKWTAGVFAVLAIALGLLFGVFRIAVSHAPEYRAPIEARASEIIGLPVSIARLDARLGLGGPEVRFDDVVVLSEDGASPILEAEHAAVSLDVTELLLRWRVRWDQITLDGILLDVLREADGGIRLLGRRLEEFPRPDPDRRLPLAEIRLQNSRVLFEDRASAGPAGEAVTWLFDDVHLSVSNRREGLRISGDFLPPPAAGERVVFWANRLTREDGWQAYAASRRIEFDALGRVRELAGRVPVAGQAGLRLWVDGHGTLPDAANAEFDFQEVVLPSAAAPADDPAVVGPPAADYQRVAGRLEWEDTGPGWEARLANVEIRRANRSWAVDAARARSRPGPAAASRQVEVAADYLKLDDLRPLGVLLPAGTLREQLATMAPAGVVRDLAVEAVVAAAVGEPASAEVPAEDAGDAAPGDPDATPAAATGPATGGVAGEGDVSGEDDAAAAPPAEALTADRPAAHDTADPAASEPAADSDRPSPSLAATEAPEPAAGPVEGGLRVSVQAELEEVSVRPTGSLPGVEGLSGRVRSDARGGRFEFDGGAVTLEFPGLFREPLALDRAEGLLLWTDGADGLMLIGDGLVLANADLALETGFRLRLADESQPGSIDLQGELTGLDVSRAGPYLPVGIMRPKLIGWLDDALLAGQVPRVDVRIAGPLRGFPYREDQGRFEVSFTALGLDLEYARGWPAATGMTADMVFANEGLSAVVREGRLSDLSVGTVRAEFEDLMTGELTVRGDLEGPLPGVQRYLVDAEPLRATLGAALDDLRIKSGDAKVEADLRLPIKDLSRRRVEVTVDVDDGVLGYEGVVFELTGLSGSLRVVDNAAFSDDLTARLLGQPVWIDVAPHRNQGVRANVRIQTTSQALMEALDLPLGRYVAGSTEVRGILQFPRPGSGQRFWMRYESDLEGMAVTLPDPLDKTATERVTYVHEVRFPGPGRQDWYMQLGDDIAARASLAVADGRVRFERATVQGGDLDVVPHEGAGLYVRGRFDEVSVDEWLALDLSGDAPADGEAQGGAARFEDFFVGADAQAGRLDVIGQRFADVAVVMTPGQDAWQIRVESEAAAGEIRVPFELAGRQRPIELDMARLTLYDEPGEGGGDGADAGPDPAAVPPMRVAVEEFRAHGIRLGRLETRLEPLPEGFSVPSFSATGPSFSIDGRMNVELGPGVDRSSLSLVLKSSDFANTLEYAGFAPAVAAESVELTVDLAWRGGLVSNVLAVGDGTASLRVGDGRLTEVKPGAGRVFGLLSVQALPRRLMLDFRDVFEKGFFFDRFAGDFTIAGGQAHTDNLAMDGRAADIGIIGSVDLVNRQYDQTAVVSAQIGNTLPVVGAIAAGPIIGGGLFILKEILKEPLREAGQVQYRITGPWENPVVAKVSDNGTDATQLSRSPREKEPGGG